MCQLLRFRALPRTLALLLLGVTLLSGHDLARAEWGCCDFDGVCIECSRFYCDAKGGTFFPGWKAEGNKCVEPPPPSEPHGDTVSYSSDLGNIGLATMTSMSCGLLGGGIQLGAHNFPKAMMPPSAPQVVVKDSAGNVVRSLHTQRVTNDSLIRQAMRRFEGYAGAEGDTVVIWSFGKLPLVGTFPDTFCYRPGEFYELTQSIYGGDPDTVTVISWYSGDTLALPDDPDYAFTFVLPLRKTPIPTLTQWGAIIFGVLLLGSVVFYIWRRRRVAVA